MAIGKMAMRVYEDRDSNTDKLMMEPYGTSHIVYVEVGKGLSPEVSEEGVIKVKVGVCESIQD